MTGLPKTLYLTVLLVMLRSAIPGADARTFGIRSSVTHPRRAAGFGGVPNDSSSNPLPTCALSVAALPRGGESGDFDLVESPFPALTGGMMVLAMASTPYVLALFMPYFQRTLLAFKTETSEDRLKAYVQQAYTVFMLATLGLCLTLFQFVEVYLLGKTSAEQVLKDSYWVWAIYYVAQTVKTWYEDVKLDMRKKESRIGTQGWHIFVALSMFGAIFGSELFVKFMDRLLSLFQMI